MKAHRLLLHVIERTNRVVRGAPGKPRTGRARAWAERGIPALALTLGSLGAVAAAPSGHGNLDHASAHPQKTNPPSTASAYSTGTSHIIDGPWMY